MARVTGSKTTKAAETASLKAARTKHRVGAGQLFIQPTAHVAREEATQVLAEALDAGVDGREEQAAIDFITGPAPVEVQAALTHVRPTARYEAPQSREARCLECQGFHRNGASCAPAETEAPALRPGQKLVKVGPQQWTVLVGTGLVTEKQAKWMMDIAHRPSITDEMRFSLRVRLQQGFARAAASAFITKYKDTPTAAATDAMVEAVAPGASTEEYVVSQQAPAVEVPAGRYALRTEEGVKFYRLDRPTQGRWAGWTFLKVQASDDLYPIKNRTEKARIIAEIAKDVLAAERLYGQELGKCSRCGRTLTDETSRAYGIGPDCRNK